MPPTVERVRAYRFGPFRADLRTGELWNNGFRLRIQQQPFAILVTLLERPGELVTREELRQRLWPKDTFVDFDLGLNVAVKKLRDALHDSAERPEYIETLTRRGYRFLQPVDLEQEAAPSPAAAANDVAEPSIPTGSRHAARRLLAIGTVFAIVVLAAVAGRLYWKARPIAFPARGWVLVAPFENRTGESLFDGTVEFALKRELSNSRFVSVVSSERLEDTLRLMRRSPETPLDLAAAREAALRDGEVALLAAGAIERVGSVYVISVGLVEPQTGRVLRALEEETSSQEEVLAAVRRLSDGVRSALGEELSDAPAPGVRLEKATTPSLRALQLYSKAVQLTPKGNWPVVTELTKQAVAEDPQFASAHNLLGHTYANLGREAEAAAHFDRALALSALATPRERYFIAASAHWRKSRDVPRAIQAFEVLLQMYPEDPSAKDIALLLVQQGRSDEAIPYLKRYADSRPHDYLANVRAARALGMWGRNLEAARAYVERARGLPTDEVRRRWEPAWIELFDAHQAWVSGDVQRAHAETVRVERMLDAKSGQEHDLWAQHVGQMYLTLGATAAAERVFLRLASESLRNRMLAIVALTRREHAAARNLLSRVRPTPAPGMAMMLIKAGMLREAQAQIEASEKYGFTSNAERGVWLLQRGKVEEGRRVLEEVARRERASGGAELVTVLHALADLQARRGEPEHALRLLEQASEERVRIYPEPAVEWMECRQELAGLYRLLGRNEDAATIERQNIALLRFSDVRAGL